MFKTAFNLTVTAVVVGGVYLFNRAIVKRVINATSSPNMETDDCDEETIVFRDHPDKLDERQKNSNVTDIRSASSMLTPSDIKSIRSSRIRT